MGGSLSVPSVLGSGASPTASDASVPLLRVHTAPKITAEAPRRRGGDSALPCQCLAALFHVHSEGFAPLGLGTSELASPIGRCFVSLNHERISVEPLCLTKMRAAGAAVPFGRRGPSAARGSFGGRSQPCLGHVERYRSHLAAASKHKSYSSHGSCQPSEGPYRKPELVPARFPLPNEFPKHQKKCARCLQVEKILMKAEWQEDTNGATVGLASLDSRPRGLDGLRHQQRLAVAGGNCSCLLHSF